MTRHDVARRAALFTAHVYVAGLIVWALLRALVGDRYWWTFLLNAFALYLFAPLPAVTFYVLLGHGSFCAWKCVDSSREVDRKFARGRRPSRA